MQMYIKKRNSVATSQVLNSSPSSIAVNNKNLNLSKVCFNLHYVEYGAENPEGKTEKQKNTDHRSDTVLIKRC